MYIVIEPYSYTHPLYMNTFESFFYSILNSSRVTNEKPDREAKKTIELIDTYINYISRYKKSN